MLEIKNTVTEMKNDFDGLISTLSIAEERISTLRICQQKLPKQKSKVKDWKKKKG